MQLIGHEDKEKMLKTSRNTVSTGMPATSLPSYAILCSATGFISDKVARLYSQSSLQTRTLAGVDDILQECYDFAINAFTLQAQQRKPFPTRGELPTVIGHPPTYPH